MFVLISTLLSVAILAGIYHLSTKREQQHAKVSVAYLLRDVVNCLDVIEQSHYSFNPNKTMSEIEEIHHALNNKLHLYWKHRALKINPCIVCYR